MIKVRAVEVWELARARLLPAMRNSALKVWEPAQARLFPAIRRSVSPARILKGLAALRDKARRDPMVSVLLIDSQDGPWQDSQPVYWRALVPFREIQSDNPRAWGAYKERHEDRIRWTRYGGPVGTGLTVAACMFLLLLSRMPPGATVGLLLLSGFVGLFLGAVVGIPLSAFVIRIWLKTKVTYVVGRIPRDRAEEIGLEVRPGANFALVWAVPPPVVAPALDGDPSSSLVAESEVAIWTLEQLKRGENGYSSELLIRALQAQHGTGGQEKSRGPGSLMDRFSGTAGRIGGG